MVRALIFRNYDQQSAHLQENGCTVQVCGVFCAGNLCGLQRTIDGAGGVVAQFSSAHMQSSIDTSSTDIGHRAARAASHKVQACWDGKAVGLKNFM